MNDGYPTEETLHKIRTNNATPSASPIELMQFVKENWWAPDFGWRESIDSDGTSTSYSLSTGGWSGNEQLISALEQNYAFWYLYWQSSSRGGHFVFTIPNVKP